MIIGVYGFLSNVNKSSVNIFITTMNSSVTEASTCTMKYFNGLNDIRLISRPIHAPIYKHPLNYRANFYPEIGNSRLIPLRYKQHPFFYFGYFILTAYIYLYCVVPSFLTFMRPP